MQCLPPLLEWLLRAAIAPPDTLTGWSLDDKDSRVIAQLLPTFEWFYHHYFQVQTDGWEHIPNGQIMLIGSHNGGLAAPDMVMMIYDWFQRFGTQRSIYGLMDPRVWQALPAAARLAAQFGAIRAVPRMAIAALNHDASLLIYPGGAKDVFRPYARRHSICLNGQQGFIKLALADNIPIIPVISYGAHETLIVLADLYEQLQTLTAGNPPWLGGIDPQVFPVYLGLPWGLAIGPLPNIPLPIHIHTRICPPILLSRSGKSAARDRAYVDDCYHQVERTMQAALDQLVAEHRVSDAP